MIIHADCVEAMQAMEPDSVDAIVCDPPYGLEFMGKEWDRLGDIGQTSHAGPSDRDGSTVFGRQRVAYSGSSNRKCATCRKWEWDYPERKCTCDKPDFPNIKAHQARIMQEWHQAWATEALRVLKPGGHLLAFGGTRTYHRLACAVEDAGFEIRDSLLWIYATGFPKSLDVSKAIDKAAGAEREVVGLNSHAAKRTGHGKVGVLSDRGPGLGGIESASVTAPATPEAHRWQGWGTALKPSHEPIVVARKPLVGTVAANVLEHGTGALNIDGCRIEGVKRTPNFVTPEKETFEPTSYGMRGHTEVDTTQGRWPPNLTLSHLPECKQTGTRKVKANPPPRYNNERFDDDGGMWFGDGSEPAPLEYGTETIPAYTCAEGCPVAELDRQSGEAGGSGQASGPTVNHLGDQGIYGTADGERGEAPFYGDTGGASRFFYVAKASRAERNAGLEGFEVAEQPKLGMDNDPEYLSTDGSRRSGFRHATANVHPTVKPIALMRWLVRLVTPKGGTVLDPFTGSGSTGVAAVLEGFDFVGIEREAEYVALAEARVAFWAQFPGADVDKVLISDARAREIEASGQLGLL